MTADGVRNTMLNWTLCPKLRTILRALKDDMVAFIEGHGMRRFRGMWTMKKSRR